MSNSDPQSVLNALENAEDAFEGRTQALPTPEAGIAARNSKLAKSRTADARLRNIIIVAQPSFQHFVNTEG
jgi:hypothetical protein